MLKILPLLLILLSCSAKKEIRPFSDYQQLASKFNNVLSTLQFEKSPTEVEQNIDQALAKAEQDLMQMVNISVQSRSFENTVGAVDALLHRLGIVAGRHYLLNSISPDPQIRQVAGKSIDKSNEWENKLYFRTDLYQAIDQYRQKNESLSGERQMLLKDILKEFHNNGLDLPQQQRKLLEKIKLERSLTEQKIKTNIREYKNEIVFTPQELEGIPESALSEIKKDQKGNYLMDPRLYSNYSAIASYAHNADVRKRALLARWQVAQKENIPLLTKVIKLRAKEANILGYKNFAQLRIEDQMAKGPQKVIDFLENISQGLEKKFQTETEILRQIKAQEINDPKTTLETWDGLYYYNKLLKQKYDFDREQMRVYFSMENVIKGVFDVASTVFNIKIEEATPPYKWVDDLRFFVILDKKNNEPLGTLYLDLYPRDGKYAHFAQFSILQGRKLEDDRHQRPIGVLVCNFPKPTPQTPSLLRYNDVNTMFHEFGHALHNLLSKTEFSANHGTSVPRDFVEVPSQLFEFWIEDKKVLDSFAHHYQHKDQKIPANFLEKIKAVKKATIARHTRGQIAFGMMDIVLHTQIKESDNFNIADITNKIMEKYYIAPPKETAFIASFGHVAGGYAAGYYGYQWALAIAYDLATVFQQAPNGYLNETIGLKLRQEIYETGKRREVEDSIKAFLGRDWNTKAYLKDLGI